MSYSISISGHKQAASEEEGRAFEEQVRDAAKEFVAGLDGVTGATFSGGAIGQSSLVEPS